MQLALFFKYVFQLNARIAGDALILNPICQCVEENMSRHAGALHCGVTAAKGCLMRTAPTAVSEALARASFVALKAVSADSVRMIDWDFVLPE